MDRLREIKEKYYKNGDESLTQDDIEYILDELEENKNTTKKEKNEWDNIIINSGKLLYYTSVYYIDKFKANNNNDDFNFFTYYCELSASKGYTQANVLLGNVYFNLENDEELNEIEDHQKAAYYYEQAAKQGDTSAQNNLGYMYQEGLGVEQDYKKAAYYYEQAAKQGDTSAQNNLGYMYQEGLGVEQDYKKAIEYYEKAAEQGNATAQNNLGYMYQKGLGVEQDYKKAIEYYEKAAEQGNATAQNNLGIIYEFGLGVKQSYKKAIEYYEKAAEQGEELSKTKIMRYKYIKEEEVEYAELFFLEEDAHKDDLYFEKIKKMIDDGKEVISVKSLTDLTQIQFSKEVQDNNKIIDYIIKSILDFLNEKGDNTIINIRQKNDLISSVAIDFYTVSDLRKIVYVCKKFLEDIDLNQPQEDVFMQIYIKLGLMISYDHDAIKEKEKISTSRNLMIFLNKKGVCQGYALILKNILDIVGIKSNILYSANFKNGTGHAYNQVEINEKWYYCDLTLDRYCMIKGMITNCLKSKKRFSKLIYHQTLDIEQEHESNEDYPNVQQLFMKNRLKLFFKKLNTPLEQLIEPAGVKEYGGRTR